MTILASETATGLTATGITGRTLDNGSGGAEAFTWKVFTGGEPCYGDGAGKIAFSSNSMSIVRDSRIRKLRTHFDPTAGVSNIMLTGFGLNDANHLGARRIALLWTSSYTSLRIVEITTVGGGLTTRVTKTTTAPAAPVWLELDATTGTTVHARVYAADGTTLLHDIEYAFPRFPMGDGWGFGGYQGGNVGRFDDIVFWDGPVAPSPLLGTPTATSTGAGSTRATVSTDKASGTLYALFSSATPDDATIIGTGTAFAVTAAGSQTVDLSGLTHAATGKVHVVHVLPTLERSSVARSNTITLNDPLPVPNTTVVTEIGSAQGQLAVIVSGVATNTASLSVSLPAAATPNGAVTRPSQTTVPDGAGNWSVAFVNPPSGTYAPATIILSNEDNPVVNKNGERGVDIIAITGSDVPEGNVAPGPEPTLSSATGVATAWNTATGSVSTNEANGTMYAVCSIGNSEPTAAQIKAGQEASGQPADYATTKAVTAVGTQDFTAVGLVGSGTWRWHFVHTDADGNDSAAARSATFATPAAPDGTAPTLTNPTGTPSSHTAATGTVSTDEADGTLYGIVSGTSAKPSAAQIKAGNSSGGAAAPWSGSKPVTATGVQTMNATGLTPASTPYWHFMHTDAAGNDSAVATSAMFTMPAAPDVTAPTLTNATAAASGPTAATGGVSTNEATGTLYWLVNTSTTATAAAVKAGASKTVTATGDQSVTPTGLTAETTGYRIHFLHRDAAGNDSAVLTSAAFNTPAAPDVTAPTLSAATAAANGPTAATGGVSTNEATGTLYWLVNTSATATGAAVKAGASKAVTAAGAQSVAPTGLTAETTGYRIHFLHRDAAGNDSAVLTSAAFNTPAAPDATPPTLSAATATAMSATAASGSVTTNEATGKLYWLVNTSATATAAAVKAGVSKDVTATGAQSVTAFGLPANTAGQRIHFLHRDAAGNDSAVLTTAAFTTPEASTGGFMKTAVIAQESAINPAGGTLEGDWIDLTDAREASVSVIIKNGKPQPEAGGVCRVDLSHDGGLTVFPGAGGTFPAGVAAGGLYSKQLSLPADAMYCRTVFLGNEGQPVTVQAVVTKVLGV